MPCIAIQANGEPCARHILYMDRYCGIHHRSHMRTDVNYRREYEQRNQEQAEQRARDERRRVEAVEQAQAQQNERMRLEVVRTEEVRVQLIQRQQREVEQAQLLSPSEIMIFARRICTMWLEYNVPGNTLMYAYTALKFRTWFHLGFPELIRSVVQYVHLREHPHHIGYQNVPDEIKTNAIRSIQNALIAYGNLDHVVPVGDTMYERIQRRLLRDEQAQREAARRERMEHAMRTQPIVFVRDPEGSINLQAFANDAESVHRSSVQNMTARSLNILMQRPLAENQDTLSEVTESLMGLRWTKSEHRERAITELTNDYFNTEAFSIRYGDALTQVWAYIRSHEHKNSLAIRLGQEIYEGIGKCSNGKMARLINVLQGFDDTLEMEVPREVFQERIARLTSLPHAQREAAARALFVEFRIPDAEHSTWLEPLLDADDSAANATPA